VSLLSGVKIKTACLSDVKHILKLIAVIQNTDVLLDREEQEIKNHIQYFKLAQSEAGLAGCCSLYIYNSSLAEIRTLAVLPAFRKKGIGRELVKACIEIGCRQNISRIFTLTTKPVFFRKLGFSEVEKASLPEKIWKDCSQCKYRDQCPETALLYVNR